MEPAAPKGWRLKGYRVAVDYAAPLQGGRVNGAWHAKGFRAQDV